MRAPVDKDSWIIRQALMGQTDDFNALPFGIRAIVQRIQRQRARQGNREVRRMLKANAYRAVALAGGGAREVARRAARQ